MKRLLVITAAAVAAAVPAVAGLTGNPALSHRVPVRVPSQAVPAAVSTVTPSRHAEPGDDRGSRIEPGDDNGRVNGRDDRRTSTATSGRDDRGGRGGHAEPGDDHGGGGDDGSGHH